MLLFLARRFLAYVSSPFPSHVHGGGERRRHMQASPVFDIVTRGLPLPLVAWLVALPLVAERRAGLHEAKVL
jgi:hypothetical protein